MMAKSSPELRRVQWERLANLLPNDTQHFCWLAGTDQLYCLGVDVDWCEHDFPFVVSSMGGPGNEGYPSDCAECDAEALADREAKPAPHDPSPTRFHYRARRTVRPADA